MVNLSEFQRPGQWRGQSFVLSSESSRDILAAVQEGATDTSSDTIQIKFQSINDMRPTRTRGHSLRYSFQSVGNGGLVHDVDIIHEEQEDDQQKQAFQTALMSFLKDKEHHDMDLVGGETEKELIITNVPMEELIAYFEQHKDTSDLVGRK